jgi:hypothetical protein
MNDQDFAVQLGETVDRGIGFENKAYPFIYNFISSQEENWERLNGTLAGNISDIAIPVASGQRVRHAIRIEPDRMFKILWYKYTVYWIDSQNSNYRWYEPIAGWFQEVDYQTAIGTPLIDSIQVSVSYLPNNEFAYGGINTRSITNLGGYTIPLAVETVQGYDYGYGQLKTPHLLARNGVVVFEITNTHDVKDLYVGGIIYGMKIRI